MRDKFFTILIEEQNSHTNGVCFILQATVARNEKKA